MRKIKILFFIDGMVEGGKERRLLELIKGLSQDNLFHCEIAVMKKDVHYSELNEKLIKIHYLIRRTRKDPAIFSKLYKMCKKLGPDIIHSWSFMTTFYSIPVVKLLGIRLVDSEITDVPQLGLIQKKVLRGGAFHFADRIVSNSVAGLMAYGPPAQKSLSIHNGFDFKRLSNLTEVDKIRNRFNIHSEYVIGMVAAFSDFKDYDTYLKTAQSIAQKRDDVTFLAIGGGKHLSHYKASIGEEYSKRVLFLGSQQRNIESIMNVCNIGVLTSYSEGISNALMEFMALSIPVVANSCGGNGELVADGYSGFLVPVGDCEALEEKILLLLDNRDLRNSMGQNGKMTISQEFNIGKMVGSFIHVYKSVLGDRYCAPAANSVKDPGESVGCHIQPNGSTRPNSPAATENL